jgi:hypothetical protein
MLHQESRVVEKVSLGQLRLRLTSDHPTHESILSTAGRIHDPS